MRGWAITHPRPAPIARPIHPEDLEYRIEEPPPEPHMPRFPYRLALILAGPENQDLGQHPIEPDWVPVRESIQFELLRRNGVNALAIGKDDFSLTPLFSTDSGEPWLEGVTAEFAGPSGPEFTLDIPNTAFVRPASRLLSAKMVAEKKVEPGDLITYRTVAFPIGETPAPSQPSPFTEVAILPAITEIAGLEATFPGTVQVETDAGGDEVEPFPIVVPQDLIDEIRAASEAAVPMETGGLLLGRLLRYEDSDSHRLAVEITAQIPAQYTESSSTSLRFTDETWAAADHAIRLRKNAGDSHASMIIGWVHSHPSRVWCSETCPLENRLACPKQSPFFSSDDLNLHREVFPKAYHVALLVNVADAGTTVSAFAAVRGVVSPVPYRVIPTSP
jgi:proteasome lid subunit RPN8/RPN11